MPMSIRERLASWIPTRVRSAFTDGFGGSIGWYGVPTLAGPAVNDRSALGIAAVYQAITLYANTIAGMDIYVAERDERGGRRPAPDHPINRLIAVRPNPITGSFGFRQAIMHHVLTRGNAYAEIERDDRGRPSALHLMDPRDVEPEIGDDGCLTYRLNDRGEDLEAKDVLHFHNLGWDGVRGYAPLTLHRETLGLAIAERVHMSGLMGNSASPGGHFEVPDKMTEPQKAEFRKNWNAKHQGPGRAGNFGIVDKGGKWVQTSFSPADSELLQSREFSVAEVARIFNLPQHMLGELEHATFSNIEEQNIQFYQLSIMPWLRAIEEELAWKLLGPVERNWHFITHDPESVVRGNRQAQVAWVEKLFNIGMLTQNEGRTRFGLPPVEGGDRLFLPLNNLGPVAAATGTEQSQDPDQVTNPTQGSESGDPEPLPAGAID